MGGPQGRLHHPRDLSLHQPVYSWSLVSHSDITDALRLSAAIWRRCRLCKGTEHLNEVGASAPTRWLDSSTLTYSIQDPMSLTTFGAELSNLNSSPSELSATSRTSRDSNSWRLGVSPTISLPASVRCYDSRFNSLYVYVSLQMIQGSLAVDSWAFRQQFHYRHSVRCHYSRPQPVDFMCHSTYT